MQESNWISMEVLSVRRETPQLVHLDLFPVSEGMKFDFQAGQCVRVLCPDGRVTAFAIANEPEENERLELLIKDQEGSIAHEICQASAGDILKVSLPFGKGYPITRFQKKDILLIGVGSGLSPLRSALKSVLRREHQFGQITFLYGARTEEDIPYQNEFNLWRKKINLHICLSQPRDSNGSDFKGRVTQFLPELSLRPQRMVACVCGTEAMQKEVMNLLERAGISKENIFLNYQEADNE